MTLGGAASVVFPSCFKLLPHSCAYERAESRERLGQVGRISRPPPPDFLRPVLVPPETLEDLQSWGPASTKLLPSKPGLLRGHVSFQTSSFGLGPNSGRHCVQLLKGTVHSKTIFNDGESAHGPQIASPVVARGEAEPSWEHRRSPCSQEVDGSSFKR